MAAPGRFSSCGLPQRVAGYHYLHCPRLSTGCHLGLFLHCRKATYAKSAHGRDNNSLVPVSPSAFDTAVMNPPVLVPLTRISKGINNSEMEKMVIRTAIVT